MSIEFMTNEELLPISIKRLEAKYKSKSAFSGIPSGIHDLDSIIGGFQKKELTIIASRPGLGKTSFALSVMINASNIGTKILYITFEMSEDNVMDKMLAQYSKINIKKIRSGLIRPGDFTNLMDAAAKIYEKKNVFIKSIYNKNIIDIYYLVNKAKTENNIDMVIIDYLTMIKPETPYQNRWEQVAEISRCLKQYAMELDISIIALCPINRYSINKIPSINDLSESGSLEYDSDCVIIIRRDEKKDESGIIEAFEEIKIDIAKNRNGPTGLIQAAYLPAYGLIANIDEYT